MWSVHKFGGTSVGNAERYKNVAKLLPRVKKFDRMAVVVSAMKGTTDALIDLTQLAKNQNPDWKKKLAQILDLHRSTLKDLTSDQIFERTWPHIQKDFQNVHEILAGVELVRSASEEIVELISGYGEVWSAQILNAHLLTQGVQSTWLDARQVLIVKPAPITVDVQWDVSRQKIKTWLAQNSNFEYCVVTGFVASTPEGVATTLKRNGSDYSASLFAYLLDASELTIWTDVDGVLSADPRLVPEAKVLDEMSYREVIELAYFGAKVVHPGTMWPAMKLGIPIQIRNTFNPDFKGTVICEHPKSEKTTTVRGFSIVENMALMNLEGTGMMGVPGVAERLFGALRSEGINVVLISQASSEHSICFAIRDIDTARAEHCIKNAFFAEFSQKQIEKIDITKDVTILAAVGDGMAYTPGVSGQFLTALGRSGVNVRAIAQGSSERNISVVIDQKNAKRALRSVHSSFYLSPYTLGLGIVGTGLIGKTFLDQLTKQIEHLKNTKNIHIQVRAVMNSKSMLLGSNTQSITSADLNQMTTPLNEDQFLAHVAADHIPHYAIIDATANADLPRRYASWMRHGFHIITPNKKGLSQDYALYREIKDHAAKLNRQYLYSTNVGAGLPLIKSIRDLVDTGDEIQSIEAVLSGTLSFIFNNLKNSFADQVREAMRLGFTEPDPRDDLSGQDVLRKMTILTREMGHNYENAEPENLVPLHLQKVSRDDFVSRLDEIKIQMPPNQILRYVASWDQSGIRVGLKTYAPDHPMAFLKYADNILIVRSARYNHQPLIVQGPGAGPAVTAGGVFADVLRLVRSLGASL